MEIAGVANGRIYLSGPVKTQNREQALTELIESHRVRLLSIIRKRIRDQVEAEDVLQDVLAEFVEAYDLGQAIEILGAWLVRVAQNKIIDRFRRRKTQDDYKAALLAASETERTSASRPDNEWMRAWLRREIIDALEMLPKEQRDVFVKHELEGKTSAEMAAETGVSVNTLLSRKRYAVRFLRNQLKEIYDEFE
jgi:RNA polymerase sigma factor (sigma-70 family)